VSLLPGKLNSLLASSAANNAVTKQKNNFSVYILGFNYCYAKCAKWLGIGWQQRAVLPLALFAP